MSLKISAQYEELIPYRKGDKYGFCNRNKQIIIQPKFDQASLFNHGYSSVSIDGKRGLINTSGDLILPFSASYKSPVNSNLFQISDMLEGQQVWGVTSLSGDTILPYQYDEITDQHGNLELTDLLGKKGVANFNGEIIIPVEYDHIRYDSNEELYVISKGRNEALFTLEGNQLTSFEYESIKDFSHGLAQVIKRSPNNENQLYGYINTAGQAITEIAYEDNHQFREGYGVVKKKGKYGIIDTLGKIKIEIKYDYINDIYSGVAPFQNDDKWGLLSADGTEIVQAKYEKIYPSYFATSVSLYNG
ncbi:MAG: WG repeat-containing protein, partial [Bacteroidota bacterium]